jgi:hypothetical protein
MNNAVVWKTVFFRLKLPFGLAVWFVKEWR